MHPDVDCGDPERATGSELRYDASTFGEFVSPNPAPSPAFPHMDGTSDCFLPDES
jgi:hypothetical protein